jgi:hypothetical protein
LIRFNKSFSLKNWLPQVAELPQANGEIFQEPGNPHTENRFTGWMRAPIGSA